MPLPPLRNPQSPLRRLWGLAKAVPIVGGLGATLLGFNGGQVASLALRPFSRPAFRAANRWIADTWWGLTVTVGQRVHGIESVLTGDDVPMRENAIVVSNHQQMPDINILLAFARTKGRLGDLKWIGKEVLKFVPGLGWGLAFLDCLFLKRDWAEDRAYIEQAFARFSAHAIPLWLVMFPEGTRVTPDKLARARRYARERGWPEPEHVLLPRTKGFVAAVRGLRGHVDAVYDLTIGYEEGVPTLWQYAQGFARRPHLHVRRYPIDTLPTDDAQLGEWLRARFREKDARLADYYRTGAFPAA